MHAADSKESIHCGWPALTYLHRHRFGGPQQQTASSWGNLTVTACNAQAPRMTHMAVVGCDEQYPRPLPGNKGTLHKARAVMLPPPHFAPCLKGSFMAAFVRQLLHQGPPPTCHRQGTAGGGSSSSSII